MVIILQKNNDRSCLVFIAIPLILIIIYKVVIFFNEPDAIAQIIQFFQTIGACIGIVIFIFFCLYIFEKISTRIKQRFIRQSRIYLARCYAVKMQKIEYESIPDDLPVEATPETYYPLLATIAITNYGVWITVDQGHYKEKAIASQIDYFHQHLENSIIPIRSAKLYYVSSYSSEGNVAFEIHPPHSAGFTDATPKLQNGHQLKIVMVFSSVIKKNNLREVIQLEHPIKLKLSILDDFGQDDLSATVGLYNVIYERIKSIEAEDDDSWMYRSRPM